MILVELPETFEEYIKSLSRKARKQYAFIKKHNQDLTYQPVPFVRDEVKGFMELWTRQLIRGEYKQWAFPIEHLENLHKEGRLKVFAADLGNERIALHFIQAQDGFWECHPPLYSKAFGLSRYLAKFMWFRLMEYGCGKLGILNLGGGVDESWREMLRRRDEFPNPRYKWVYVPERIKDNPEEAKDYELKELNGIKYLHERS